MCAENRCRCDSSSYLIFIWCCFLNRDAQIDMIPSAITCTPSLCLIQSILLQTNSVSSSYFFQVFFGCSCFLLPLTSRSRTTLKTLSSFLLSTYPYHLTHLLLFSSILSCLSVLQLFFCQQLSDCTWLSL